MTEKNHLYLVKDYRLVTVGVFYYLPEYNNIIQEFVWQTEDCIPELLRIHKFLNHWENHIDAKIQKVNISYTDAYRNTKFNHINYEFPVFLT